MKVKGKVTEITEKKARNGKIMWKAKIGNKMILGFGKCPFVKGQEVEVDYETNESGFNWIKESKTENNNDKIEALIKMLAIPKLHVGIQEHVNVKNFSWKEYTINMSIYPEEVTLEDLNRLFALARQAIKMQKQIDEKGG